MDSQILGSIMTALATVISAFIGGWVAIKVKDMELNAREAKTDELLTQAERKAVHWLWGVGGVIAGIIMMVVMIFITLQLYPDRQAGLTIQRVPAHVTQVMEPVSTIPFNKISLVNEPDPQPTSTPILVSQNIPLLPAPTLTNNNLINCSSIARGETYIVTPEIYIVGDVVVDGEPQHDYREKEGTVVFLEREATVYAEWGAACYCYASDENGVRPHLN